jgi:hypothetical protein
MTAFFVPGAGACVHAAISTAAMSSTKNIPAVLHLFMYLPPYQTVLPVIQDAPGLYINFLSKTVKRAIVFQPGCGRPKRKEGRF